MNRDPSVVNASVPALQGNASASVGSLLVVGEGVRIQGKVNAPGAVHLLGCLEGDLVARELTVAESGELVGSVVAEQVEIRGTVRQNVTGSRSITIRSTARIEGDVRYAELEIEAGAQLDGTLHRLVEHASEAAQATDSQ